MAEPYEGDSGPSCSPVSLMVMGTLGQAVETMLGWTGVSGRLKSERLPVMWEEVHTVVEGEIECVGSQWLGWSEAKHRCG